MNPASKILRYILPAALTGGVIASCLTLEFRRPNAPTESESVSFQIYRIPHGRCLVAMVEPDGVYVGKDRIGIDDFGAVFDAVYRPRKLDWAMVLGSAESRYGDTVKVYSKLHAAFGDRLTMETVPVKSGTRWEPVEVLNRWGELPSRTD